jgi:hypothetical protein
VSRPARVTISGPVPTEVGYLHVAAPSAGDPPTPEDNSVDKQATLCTRHRRWPRSTIGRPQDNRDTTAVHTAPHRWNSANGVHPHCPQHLLLLLKFSLYKDNPSLLG